MHIERGVTPSVGRRILSNFSQENRVLLIIFSTFFLKIIYTFSRDTFMSGPDAEGYVGAGIDIAQKGLWSDSIYSIPFYSLGYPIVIALFVGIFGSAWVVFFQVFQISLSCLCLWLIYKVFKMKLSDKLITLMVLTLALSPANFVLSSQAIPDNFLQILLVASIYFLRNHFMQTVTKRSNSSALLFGLIVGLAIVVHARVILIMLLITLVVLVRSHVNLIQKAIFVFGGMFFPSLILARNFLVLGKATLSDSTFFAYASGHLRTNKQNSDLGLITQICEGISCNMKAAVNAPASYVVDTIENLVFFWSPNSGALQRGVWFHNISVYSKLDSIDLGFIAVFIAFSLSFLSFLLFILGSVIAFKRGHLIMTLLSLAVYTQWLLDGLLYGSNLHRMTVFIFLVPIQYLGIEFLLAKYMKLTNFKLNFTRNDP